MLLTNLKFEIITLTIIYYVQFPLLYYAIHVMLPLMKWQWLAFIWPVMK